MRRKLLVIILLIVMFIGISPVNAATNPYNQKERVPNNSTDKMTNCTWYAWQQAYDNTGVALPSLGNAKNWYAKAKSLGWHVGTEARANSIAVWDGSTYGHVGYVVSVNGSRMTINEGGIYDVEREFDEAGNMISMKYVAYNGTGIYNGNWASTIVGGSRYEDDSSAKLVGFIYLDYVPATTTTSKKTTTTKTSSAETSTTTTNTATTVTTTIKTTVDEDEVEEKETEEISEEKNTEETSNLKGILPYLILISLSLLFLLLVLAKITKSEK